MLNQLQELEQSWTEPLHEYAQFASIIKKLLDFRHQKHAQLELTQDALEHKRANLDDLERNEREASRLEEALGRGRATVPFRGAGTNGERLSPTGGQVAKSIDRSKPNQNEETEGLNATETSGEYATPESTYLPPHPTSAPPPRRSASGMGLLNALSYTLHGMMDVDPETARRNGISKTRESISQVWSSLALVKFYYFRTLYEHGLLNSLVEHILLIYYLSLLFKASDGVFATYTN